MPRGLNVLTGSCPWPGSWSGSHGAHLQLQAREDPVPTVDAVPSTLDHRHGRAASEAKCDPATQKFAMSDKSTLREESRARRADLARACPDFAQRIARSIDELPIPKGAGVSFYWPMGDEADPRALAFALAARGHTLGLPVVVKKKSPLVFRRWRMGDALVTHAFGMREPPATAPEVTPDVLLVPLLAFDATGTRLGYGGGFYDRTLAALATKLAIGIAYAGQEMEGVPRESSDQPLDMVVTERGVRAFR